MCDVPSIAVFVVNLSSVFLVQLPNFSLSFRYYSSGSNYYWYNHTFQVPHSFYLYT